ncbi:MAG: site-2 protease family protein, partial [Planctomycetota bacterium]
MTESKDYLKKNYRAFLLLCVLAAAVYFIAGHIAVFGNILLVLLGFGGVVIVHEFGHFIVAKLSGIKVEAFSIFMPPTLLGIMKTENGLRLRVLPKLFPAEDEESDEGGLGLTIGKRGKAGQTEYRIGVIPFGGYVKMLGQEDVGVSEASDDPRSYANKPVPIRIAVIAAGVLFNALSAIIVFMIVFLIGIKLPPPIVGGVAPDSPAARAGLEPGDEIIEIAGKSRDLDFANIAVAGAQMRGFGIEQAISLTVADLHQEDSDKLFERTGLRPGDRIRAVNGKDVQHYWQFEEIVEDAFAPSVTLLAERGDPASGEVTLVEARVSMTLNSQRAPDQGGPTVRNIYSMVPRLRIVDILPEFKEGGSEYPMHGGDIILSVGKIKNPTFRELRRIVWAHEDKELSLQVLRSVPEGGCKPVDVTVIPRFSEVSKRVLIGVHIELDFEHPVVAQTIDLGGGSALAVPRGAVIAAVGNAAVSNFFDIARQIRQYAGESVAIKYQVNGQAEQDVLLQVNGSDEPSTVTCALVEMVPFRALERTYKAEGPVDAIVTGYRKTLMFIAQSYVTLRRLLEGLVSPKHLMGPVGIVTLSYRIVTERPFIYYAYFISLISA